MLARPIRDDRDAVGRCDRQPLGTLRSKEDEMTIRPVAVFLALIVIALAYVPGVSAQLSNKVYRFGWVAVFPPPTELPAAFKALKARLAERGYVEGKNITFEGKWADGDYRRIPQLVAELERSGVDVIFTPGSKNARIVRNLVKKTPVVSYTCDPFEFVDRLARQGGSGKSPLVAN
jgi:putative ABC transport system substrate-binding protein